MPTTNKLAAACLLVMALIAPSAQAAEIRFNRDIRPILSDNCFACHGPDSSNRKAKLRLDLRENAIEKEAIVPGDLEKSELVKRVLTSDPDDLMPPPESHKTLSDAEKDLLKNWVAQGAEYEPHWAYIKPVRADAPKTQNKRWIRTPVDAFILAQLEAKNIKPSPQADKRTLLRRASLDLTGLPPTPEEMARFLANRDPKAFAQEVERLLRSPHYGERMAVPWLDVVRFADTVGYHGDQNQRIFPYRDYVINAFNANKPFDEFVIEQLAGDLLPNPTEEQLVATGFNRLNMMTREGGAQPKEYLAKYGGDRVRAVSTAFLGSTMGCAECHDHKFDPFTAKDFYAMAAFFADVKQWGVYSDYNYTPNPDLKGWSNDHPFPPEIEVESPYLKRRAERLREELNQLAENTAGSGPIRLHFDAWRKSAGQFLDENPSGWATPKPKAQLVPKKDEKVVTESALREDGSVLLTGKGNETLQFDLPLKPGVIAALKVELLPHETHKGRILRSGGSGTVALSASMRRGAKDQRLDFYDAQANLHEPRYSNGFEIQDVRGNWRLASSRLTEPHTAVWLLNKPIEAEEGDLLRVNLGAIPAGLVRISVSPFAFGEPDACAEKSNLRALLDDAGAKLAALYLASTATEPRAFEQFKKLHREILECRDGRAWTMVTEAWKPVTTRILPRGNWQDDTGEVVEPAPPEFLSVPSPEGKRLNRLDLAKWVVSPDNPLTGRTVVNRLWRQFFGAGISATIDDLGMQGEPPSHPELLDWLAVEFVESGWDMKHVIRLIVNSAAYQQSSNLREDLREIDPNNRLLASQNPRRLEAEFVRDNALAIANLINLEIGGPSAHPYQPPGYYVNLQFPDRDYFASKDERQYRRGVYAHWQRTFLQPMLANFDAPSREECTAFRVVSNTPQQALTLLNDPTFVEAARVFARNILQSKAKSDDARLDHAFEKAVGRKAGAEEKSSLGKFLAEQRKHYTEHTEEPATVQQVGIAPAPDHLDARELAAWTQVCRVLLNLHETITIY